MSPAFSNVLIERLSQGAPSNLLKEDQIHYLKAYTKIRYNFLSSH